MTSQIRVDEITNRSGLGTVTIYDNGFEFTGVTTFTEDVDITGGLTIGGVLTYEDVTNIDSVGVVTARAGIRVTGDSIHVESSEDRLLYLKSTDANAYLTFEDTNSSSGFANRVGTVSDGLYFSTGGGGERLRITSAGNVGINETSPDTYLHVKTGTDSASVKLEQTATNGRVQIQYLSPHGNWYQGIVGASNSGDYLIYTGQSKNLTFHTNGELRQKIQSDGKVIIGGNANQTANRDLSVVAAQGNSNEVQLGLQPTNSSGNYNPEVFISAISDGTYGAHMYFKTRDTSGNRLERLRITSGGNIGIGEGQPDRKLHVNSGATDTALKLESTDTEVSLELADNTGSSYIGGGGSHLNFYTGGNERARFDSSGNFGLGTNNPNDQTSGGYRSFTVNGSSGGIIDLRRGDIALSGGRLVGLQHEFGLEARSQNSSSQISFYVNNAYTGRWTVDGLCFGNDTAAANALDDYEEGYFTPTIYTGADNGSGGSVPFSIQAGRYIKIGRKVHCDIYLRFATGATSTGTHARIGNLPFTIANETYGNVGAGPLTRGGGVSSFHNTTADITTCYGNNNVNYFYLYINGEVGFLFGAANNVNIAGKYWIGFFEYICTP